MLTETQKRALRAQSMITSGMDLKKAARECGYKNVNGMMSAIALALRKLPEEERETQFEQMRQTESPVENMKKAQEEGLMIVRMPRAYATYGSNAGSVHVGLRDLRKWLCIWAKDHGGEAGLVNVLMDISASTKALAKMIAERVKKEEENGYVDRDEG